MSLTKIPKDFMNDKEKLILRNPGDKWCLQENDSVVVAENLRCAYENSKVNWTLQEFSFQFAYSQTIKKLNHSRPRTNNYNTLLLDKNQEEMAKMICWIVLYDICYYKCIKNDIKKYQKQIYDSLSMKFYHFRSKTSKLENLTCEYVITYYAVCAESITYQVILANFPEINDFVNNEEFVRFVDSLIRGLIIGFASKSTELFSIVWETLTLKTQKLVPKSIDNATKINELLGEDTTSADIEFSFKEGKRYKESIKSGENIIFHENTRTGLMDNALKLRGAYEPVEEKVRAFKLGSTDSSKVAASKTKAIIRETEKMVEKHITKRDSILMDVCDIEEKIRIEIAKTRIMPLGFSFETFGYNPICGRLNISVPKTARPMMRNGTWKDFTLVKRKARKEPTAETFISRIEESHKEMLEHFYPSIP